MRSFREFDSLDSDFWTLVKFVSESLGYSRRNASQVSYHSISSIEQLLGNHHYSFHPDTLEAASKYIEMRANLLNDVVENNLMTAEEAREVFEDFFEIYEEEALECKIPMNKQSGNMKRINYFTAIINIISELCIKEALPNTIGPGFDDDPRSLVYFLDEHRKLIGSTSRRFDGVYPSTINPKLIWEIKEYYYATTFGSRVADGVYETQLDGFELNEIEASTQRHIEHVYFIDAYKTWWVDGKSFLCKIIDALNRGLVDEVIVGREVLIRWPILLKSMI